MEVLALGAAMQDVAEGATQSKAGFKMGQVQGDPLLHLEPPPLGEWQAVSFLLRGYMNSSNIIWWVVQKD